MYDVARNEIRLKSIQIGQHIVWPEFSSQWEQSSHESSLPMALVFRCFAFFVMLMYALASVR